MDLAKRDALLRQIGYSGNYDCFPVAVSLESYFDGNDDPGSFWCNLMNQPDEMGDIYKFICGIRGRADVEDVKVLITQYDGGADEWPFSDTLLISTNVDPKDVETWFDEFGPDEIDLTDRDTQKLAGFQNCVVAWWD